MDLSFILIPYNWVVNLIDIKSAIYTILAIFRDYQTELITITVIGITTLLAVIYYFRRWKHKDIIPVKVKEFVGVGSHPRFRKRDKVIFYGKKIMRKVKSISGEVHHSKKRKLLLKFARNILQIKKESSSTQLQVLEPPAEYLEEDISLKFDQNLPPDAQYLLQSLRVFGNFEKPVFLTLCKHTETLTIPAGGYLFKIGDPDENLYVVQSGLLNVFITDSTGANIPLKKVAAGDSVTSLLSFIDVLMDAESSYKTVSARALEESTVVRLPMKAFQAIFQEYPDILIRVMQVIMVRLQRVTFTTLHEYLGLTVELMRGPSTQTHHSHHHRNRRGSGSPDSPEVVKPYTFPGHRFSNDGGSVRRDIADAMLTAPGTSPLCQDIDGSHIKKGKGVGLEDCEGLKKNAISVLGKEMGLEDENILEDHIDIVDFPANSCLMKQDSHKDIALVYLLSGTLVMSQRPLDSEIDVNLVSIHPGEVVGGMAVLTGEASFFTIRSRHASKVALLSRTSFYEIIKLQPTVVLHIAHMVVKRLSPFVRQVDFALDWVFLESGRALYRQESEADCTYIVLSGRLRSVITRQNGKKELVGDSGRGELVGIVEMVTKTARTTTVMAVRDSELARLPEGLFNVIKLRYPIVVTRIINLLGHHILGTKKSNLKGGIDPSSDLHQSVMNFATVALLPATDDVPLTAFGYELLHSLSAIGPTLRLTSEVIRKTLGPSIFDANNEYRLASWLAQQEDQHKIAIYQCDTTFSYWTQRCLRQADCVLIVGLAEKGPAVGKMEKETERLSVRTQRELVLLHRENAPRPCNTVEWLNARSWVSSHHHIQCTNRMFSKRSQSHINELYQKVLASDPNVHSDFSRLARWLTGMSVGLVLGGGGARGAAHVGMIKAIQEAGIPIDMVGGVSIGSFVGGLWCMEKNVTTMTQKARDWSRKMTQWWRQLLDLTYPVTSIFTGKDFNQTIQSTFGEVQIEDLWLPYFNVTTDISSSSMRIHRHGTVWRYVRASMSLSGYMPPICDPHDGHLLLDGGYVNNLPGMLWRFVRASMSISGIFPPICDPSDGHLLLDGCYVNNVPADVMRSQGARHILAIDVGSHDDQDLTNYGDSLSGFWLLYKRWNPFTQPVKVPDLPDIQSRLSYVSCVRQLEEVKNSDYCEYIRPPVDQYKTLSFGLFDEIKDAGYNHGRTYFSGLLKEGTLPLFKTDPPRQMTSQNAGYSFTDLAQMVCKVQRSNLYDSSSPSSESEDDEEETQVGYASEPSSNILKSRINAVRRGMSLSENELELPKNLTKIEIAKLPKII